MVIFCDVCNKMFRDSFDLQRHNQRKIPCKLKIEKLKKINEIGNEDLLHIDVEHIINEITEINKIFKDRVCMIFSGGIFIDVKGKFKVLIPLSSLENFVFNQEKKNFTNTKTSLVIKESDLIDVKITGVKFSKKNFSCFGEFLKCFGDFLK